MSALSDQITGAWDEIGSYTAKTQARRTGFSLHVKFDREVDVMTSILFSKIMSESPQKLLDLAQALEQERSGSEADHG